MFNVFKGLIRQPACASALTQLVLCVDLFIQFVCVCRNH